MQYVGRAIGSVTKSWSSINPATLSGAIDVIVVEHMDGEMSCSPFHVRFGKFQIFKPSQKKVEVIVNGQPTDIPMKLGDTGEAYFVFQMDTDLNNIPEELITSPVVSAASSPSLSPRISPGDDKKLPEPDFLDINDGSTDGTFSPKTEGDYVSTVERPVTPTLKSGSVFKERLNKKLEQKRIPNRVDNKGNLLLDIEGYKSNQERVHDTDEMLKMLLQEELGQDNDISPFVKEDDNGHIRIVNPYDHLSGGPSPPSSPASSSLSMETVPSNNNGSEVQSEYTDSLQSLETLSPLPKNPTGANYIKSIRLTSDQLHCLDLKYGENDLTFSVDKGRAFVTAKLFLWKWDVPIVISDIDGTITKSDALGHVLTMIGKDWTHPGVAKLFTEIQRNGYNIMYLTARSAGQADSTRSYLRCIQQDGCTLPFGPVILSPDRTIAALRREVILKKPEVFKIACLNDIRKLYFHELQAADAETAPADGQPTPFYAGFGNRITDALSYRTVGIPSSRIFTINPDGEVHMELLELTALRSSYVHINELVDQFFPHIRHSYLPDDDLKSLSPTPGSPAFHPEERSFYRQHDEKFSDFNYWRDPVPNLDDLSDSSSVCSAEPSSPAPSTSPTPAPDPPLEPLASPDPPRPPIDALLPLQPPGLGVRITAPLPRPAAPPAAPADLSDDDYSDDEFDEDEFDDDDFPP
ncbi:FAFL195Wp [Eremothecium gossypii FDAG1]|nr:FAFL195Wp [Eremothecium gossypii FDAG1]